MALMVPILIGEEPPSASVAPPPPEEPVPPDESLPQAERVGAISATTAINKSHLLGTRLLL
jgi:hypothetical protein